MKDIIAKYKLEEEKFQNEYTEISEEMGRLETEMRALKAREAELKAARPSPYDVINVLADKLSDHFGLPYKIYGPFGLECETSIYLMEDVSKGIVGQKTISITLRPFGDHENDWITYDTGERTDRYAKDTIGEMNGYNSVYAPLPTDFNDILKLMRTNDKEVTLNDKLSDAKVRSTATEDKEAVGKTDYVKEQR